MNNHFTPNRTKAFFKAKCPHCQSGSLFTHPFYDLVKFRDMNKACPVCGQKYERELGFFWAALYISFAVNVCGFVIMLLILHNFFEDVELIYKVIVLLGTMVLFSTLNFRFSRVISIYLLSGIKFNSEAVQNSKK